METVKRVAGRDGECSQRAEVFLVRIFPTLHEDCTPDLCECVGEWGLVVGREPDAKYVLKLTDPAMSRVHFALRWESGGLVIEDCGSRNGTRVNGRVVTRSRVGVQDVIVAGDTVFLLTSSAPVDLSEVRRFGLVSCSAQMGAVLGILQNVASHDFCVLYLGETGTGKEVCARVAHAWSGRPGAFLAFNCVSVPDSLLESSLFGIRRGAYTGAVESSVGWFERAGGGTLLLDEVGDLPGHLQAKLLRVIEERAVYRVGADTPTGVDVRLMAATNRPDVYGGSSGSLRPDLLARLEDAVVRLPALRDRREDIVPVAGWVLAEGGGSPGLMTAGFVERLACYGWPRNVRQLVKVMRVAASMVESGGLLTESCLELPPETGVRVDVALRPDADVLVSLLERTGGSVAEVARLLGVDRRQVYRWLEAFSIVPGDFRKGAHGN